MQLCYGRTVLLSCLKKVNLAGLEKSAAIRPFATKKSRLASEKILIADSFATESCRLVDRLATKLFSKRTTPMRTERDCARSLADVFVGPRCNGSWPFGPVDRVCEYIHPLCLGAFPDILLPRPSERCGARDGENIVRAVTVSLRGTLVST